MLEVSATTDRARRRNGERGHMLLIAVVLIVFVMVLGFSSVGAVNTAKGEHSSDQVRMKRLYLAESGLDAAMNSLRAGGPGTLGTETLPVTLGQGAFWTVASEHGDGSYTVTSWGRYANGVRSLRAEIRKSSPVFHHAIFAGNSSGDPSYTMEFGGTGAEADQINGDVYSGGGIRVVGDATLTGEVRAEGTISGTSGTSGIAQPGFDFRGVDFSGPDVVDVAAEFAALATPQSSALGGVADQVPATSLAHIFRRNPDDRLSEINGTVKNDYFLEDPYETGSPDPSGSGTIYPLTIDDGTGVTRATYYVDGNLWVHSGPALSYLLKTAALGGVQVTFVVHGNITFSDNLYLEDQTNDAIAFVALKDEDVADSGNIYMGDPAYGTLSELHAYLYAEQDFLDVNLDADGAKTVRLLGTMSAGNHVAIDRTTDEGAHSKLTVDWDARLQLGFTSLPLISTDIPESKWTFERWAEISPDAP